MLWAARIICRGRMTPILAPYSTSEWRKLMTAWNIKSKKIRTCMTGKIFDVILGRRTLLTYTWQTEKQVTEVCLNQSRLPTWLQGGHLPVLSTQETKLFKALKQYAQTEFPAHDLTDIFIIRCLTARKWDITRAQTICASYVTSTCTKCCGHAYSVIHWCEWIYVKNSLKSSLAWLINRTELLPTIDPTSIKARDVLVHLQTGAVILTGVLLYLYYELRKSFMGKRLYWKIFSSMRITEPQYTPSKAPHLHFCIL